jgi:predicted ATP-grasp superfamily ATP-dependent carboligase
MAENPVIVKPRSKELWKQSTVFQTLLQEKGKARVFRDGREVLAQPLLASLHDQIVIQDYIPGGDDQIYSFHGLAGEGELMEWFLGRKIRTFPKQTGESCFIELVKDKELFSTGCEIAKKLGLKGVFKMDFKRDIRDGRFYLLEINARFSLWHHLGAVNGVNIPRAAYEYLMYGTRRGPSAYDTKYRWHSLLLDYQAYRELRDLGEISLWGWLKSLFLGRRIHDIFLWNDPMPFFHWLMRYLTKWLHKRVHRWLSTAS